MPIDLLDERNAIITEVQALGFFFTGGGVGFGAWDMDLEYPGWEVFLSGDGREYTMTAYPAQRDEDDDASFSVVCTTRQALVEHLTQLRVELDRDSNAVLRGAER